MDMIAFKYITKDMVNWWLSYLLSQPVELDIMIVLYLLLHYIGIVQLSGLVRQTKPYLFSIVGKFKKGSLEVVGG
jgi:hypothetical protein